MGRTGRRNKVSNNAKRGIASILREFAYEARMNEPERTKSESIAEYLARGGRVTMCPGQALSTKDLTFNGQSKFTKRNFRGAK